MMRIRSRRFMRMRMGLLRSDVPMHRYTNVPMRTHGEKADHAIFTAREKAGLPKLNGVMLCELRAYLGALCGKAAKC